MEDVLRTERGARKFRLAALLLVSLGIYLDRREVALWPALALALLYLIYLSLPLFALIQRMPARWLPYYLLAIDTLFAAWALSLFGVDSPAFVLMPVMAVYYALYLNYAGTLIMATLIAFVYIALAYVQGADVPLGRMLPIQIPLFYLIALFSSYGAYLRRQSVRERQELAMVLQTERGARVLLEMMGRLASVLQLDTLVAEMLRIAAKAAGCSYAAIRLVDEGSKELGSVASVFSDANAAHAPDKAKLETPLALERQSLQQRAMLERQNPEAGELGPWAVLSPAYVLVVPLSSEAVVAGTILLLNGERHVELTAAERDLIRSLAEFFARFIATSRAYAANQRRAARVSGELRGTVERVERKQRRQGRDELRVGHLLLEPTTRRVFFGEKRVQLTVKEFEVLYQLAQQAGQPVHPDVLLREVWAGADLTRSNAIEVTMNRLRRKLDEQAGAVDLIKTLRGTGYILDRQHKVVTKGIAQDKESGTPARAG